MTAWRPRAVIYPRRGSGFYVAESSEPFALSHVQPQRELEIDPLWVSRQSLDADPESPKPGCGWLPADWMPNATLRRAMRGLGKADEHLLSDYGSAAGTAKLRRLISRRLTDQGIDAGPDRILLTTSGSQAIDMVCRLLLQPGDTVLVDDPCYFNFRALLLAHKVDVVSVPYTPVGPDIAAFEAVLLDKRPRLYVTNSALHNPTGATITPQIAHRLLTLAATHDLTVLEDDIFAEFEPDPSPRLAALDGLERVIRVGSFTKTLSASVRCGYIAANPGWIDALLDLQVATNFGGPSPLVGELLHAALCDGGYRKHMDALRRRLARSRHEVAAKLAEMGVRPWLKPRGGFYLWCEMPDARDATEVARTALSDGIVLAPGNVFSVTQSKPSFMRFNVSQMTDPRCFAVLERALA